MKPDSLRTTMRSASFAIALASASAAYAQTDWHTCDMNAWGRRSRRAVRRTRAARRRADPVDGDAETQAVEITIVKSAEGARYSRSGYNGDNRCRDTVIAYALP